MPEYSADHSHGQDNTTIAGSNVLGTKGSDTERRIAAIRYATANTRGAGLPPTHVDPHTGFIRSDVS